MKVILGLLFFFPLIVFSQDICQDRYRLEVFADFDSSLNVQYGTNQDLSGNTTPLLLDMYEPQGDTLDLRPLIIFVHGGGFVQGTKEDPKIVRICTTFAKKGYVTSSIDYRLGIDTSNGNTFFHAGLRAMHDAKATVRYFRQHASIYGIDTSLIFMGGCSAGGITALHTAYLGNSELQTHINIDTTLYGMDNNITGSSGNSGYSSKIHGIINCWGAVSDTLWIQSDDLPVLSVFGENDNTVPPEAGVHPTYPSISLQGSKVIHSHSIRLGNTSYIKPYAGMGHGHSAGDPRMDTTLHYITNFLCHVMENKTIPLNTQEQNAFSINLQLNQYNTKTIYLDKKPSFPMEFEVYDITGKTAFKDYFNSSDYNFSKQHALVPGIYILRSFNDRQPITEKLIAW